MRIDVVGLRRVDLELISALFENLDLRSRARRIVGARLVVKRRRAQQVAAGVDKCSNIYYNLVALFCICYMHLFIYLFIQTVHLDLLLLSMQDRLPERVQNASQGRDHAGCRQAFPRAATFRPVNRLHSNRLPVRRLCAAVRGRSSTRRPPWGPHYFCLVIMELVESLKSELTLSYLDDITIGDTADLPQGLHAAGGSSHQPGVSASRYIARSAR